MSDEAQLGASGNDLKVKAPANPVKKTKESKTISAGQTSSAVPNKKVALKKLEPDTAKLLISLRDKVNKKDLGRKIRDSEIIHLGLSLIEQHHLDAIKESTYSERDRLHMAHQDYQKVHGKLSLDQYIGKLLRGEIRVAP
ncbi:hypothetical protein ACES2I_08905 [Bdellovibrio bacteriovorus]|uniref:hypothetical protein n=1 Tax=Bdellovibrio bacteriovorus TaxID=959 RepID=UPI0035A72307